MELQQSWEKYTFFSGNAAPRVGTVDALIQFHCSSKSLKVQTLKCIQNSIRCHPLTHLSNQELYVLFCPSEVNNLFRLDDKYVELKRRETVDRSTPTSLLRQSLAFVCSDIH